MTLHTPQRFHEFPPAGFDGLFDWDFLMPAFAGSNARPSDIDSMIERRGHLLFFETKKPGVIVPEGQKIALRSLWRLGRVSIMHIEGKNLLEVSGLSVYSELENHKRDLVGDRPLQAADGWDLLFLTRRWFCRMSGWHRPSRAEWDAQLEQILGV